MLYYYTKAILSYDFYYTLKDFYFYRVFVVSLIDINIINIFILSIFIEVESNISNIFLRFYSRVIYKVFVFSLFIIVFIIILLSLLIVNNYNNIVLYSFNSNEFNRLRFLFI